MPVLDITGFFIHIRTQVKAQTRALATLGIHDTGTKTEKMTK